MPEKVVDRRDAFNTFFYDSVLPFPWPYVKVGVLLLGRPLAAVAFDAHDPGGADLIFFLHRREKFFKPGVIFGIVFLIDDVRPVDVRLFGSVARGTFTPESDIDVLLVVQNESRQIRDAVIETAVEINSKHDVVIAPIIMSKDRYAGALFRETLFYKSLQEEGRPL